MFECLKFFLLLINISNRCLNVGLDSILILQLHNALFMNVKFNVPNQWFENNYKIINIFQNSKIDKHLHLIYTFSFKRLPKNASEEDTHGSTI